MSLALDTSPLEVGFVLATNQFAAFLTAMVFGYVGEKHCLGRVTVLCTGLLVLGGSTMMFGALHSINPFFAVMFVQGK